MRCSATSLFLTIVNLVGAYMSTIAGYMALGDTLKLFRLYGPDKGNGNPALDDPPRYWVNPNTKQWEMIDKYSRGNLVPQVFQGVQYYLIALAVFMTINAIAFMVDSVRSKKAVNDRTYQGRRTGLSAISCTGWLAGYSFFLTMLWLVMVGFGVLPLVEWVITMQRCWDLDSFSDASSQYICVDLVQYGLVFFRDRSGGVFGLICGKGPIKRGDLEGLCSNYYPTFSLFLASFIGSCIALLSEALFSIRHATNFVYLKVRRYENPHAPPDPNKNAPYSTYPESNYGNSVPNPNYENNVLLLDPSQFPRDADVGSYRKSPDGDVMEMREMHYGEGDHHQASRRYPSSVDESVPSYPKRPPSYSGSTRRHRRRSRESFKKPRQYDDRPSSRGRYVSSDDDSDYDAKIRHNESDQMESSDHALSTSSYRPKPLRRKSRGARSDPDIPRQSERSRRKKSRRREESPPSDFYMQEDRRRQGSRSVM
ncbi:uncharacterized protein LOC143455510 [Clavelina lepadiformis]|uniref:Uncharacterized protein n=1 Tax=Clavelina lepadiformis TaxID=159417 RepID=A0ABP0FYA5_CLALP